MIEEAVPTPKLIGNRVELPPGREGHVEKLSREFVNNQRGRFSASVAYFSGALSRLKEIEAVESAQRNLDKCLAKVAYYEGLEKLFTDTGGTDDTR